MRPRAYSFAILLGIGAIFVLPILAHTTGIPYWGPIVPSENSVCPGNWGGLLQIANNLIAVAITISITFIAPLLIAYAGFLYVVEGASPGSRNQANTVLKNAVIGIVVAMAAWIIVDAALTALTNQGVSGWTGQIFSGSGTCLQVAGALNQVAPGQYATSANGSNVGTNGAPPLSTGQDTCNPDVLQKDAQDANLNISQTELNTLACISSQESTCGSRITGANSSAGGAWQVLMQTNAPAFNNSACESAAGVSGPLNCQQGFSGGHSLNNSTSQACQRAAANGTCALAAANYMVAQHPGCSTGASASCYTDWTSHGDPNHAVQQACVNKYTGG